LRDHFAGVDTTDRIGPEEKSAFRWGVGLTLRFSKGHDVLTAKRDCRVQVPYLDRPATCDCVIPGALVALDWKTGQRRDYKRQMAAYALGQMRLRFAVNWTCAVLYLDEEETEIFRFTEAEADAIVAESRAGYDAPGAPRLNESCSWCANFYECPTQLTLAGEALANSSDALNWPGLLNNPERLSRFVQGCKALEPFEKEARNRIREYLLSRAEVPGFTLVNGKRSWRMEIETLLLLLSRGDELTVRKALRTALQIWGDMPKEKYLALCQALGLTADMELLTVSKGEPYIKATKG
jgi:hypothetical protein